MTDPWVGGAIMAEQSETAREAGEAVGGALSWLGELFTEIWTAIGPTVGDFLSGVASGAGMKDAGWLEWGALAIGALMALAALKGILAGEIIGSLVGGLIGLALIAFALG